MKKTAIILFNLGGPSSLSEVKGFLFNLFNDKAIIGLPQPFRFLLAKFISSKREKKAQNIYESIGGKSPILDNTLNQAYNLEKELSYLGNFKTFVSMRYSAPLAKNVVKDVLKYDPTEVILLPLYPQFSTTTSGSSLGDFANKIDRYFRKNNKKLNLKIVCCYPKEPDFIKSYALLIKQTLSKAYNNNLEEFKFLFSAHGLPQKVINAGDPYVFQVEVTTKAIVENLAQLLNVTVDKINFQICYQSKVGPLQWTSPSLDLTLRRTVLDKKIPVIIPVSFVSEHSETLAELDIEYKNLAKKMGAKNYLRVPALNSDGHFIKSLSEICKKVSATSDAKCFSAQGINRICPKTFSKCPNPCSI
ncbi:MAG: ferrochelatase [Rickettsiales bacterium]|nr:ferrochelatase [Rickettsiales bacterium]